MDAGLDTLGGYFNPILEYFRNGFATVNAAQGLVVALVAVILMRKWGHLLIATFVSAIVYVFVEHFWKVFVDKSLPFGMPPVLEAFFWQRFGAVFVGLLVIIAMFYAVKSVLSGMLNRPAPAAGAPAKKKG